jgi:hypothetical protein
VSLQPELYTFVAEHSKKLQSNQSKWIASLIEREFKLEQRKKIDRVLSGVDSANFKSLKTPNNL